MLGPAKRKELSFLVSSGGDNRCGVITVFLGRNVRNNSLQIEAVVLVVGGRKGQPHGRKLGLLGDITHVTELLGAGQAPKGGRELLCLGVGLPIGRLQASQPLFLDNLSHVGDKLGSARVSTRVVGEGKGWELVMQNAAAVPHQQGVGQRYLRVSKTKAAGLTRGGPESGHDDPGDKVITSHQIVLILDGTHQVRPQLAG